MLERRRYSRYFILAPVGRVPVLLASDKSRHKPLTLFNHCSRDEVDLAPPNDHGMVSKITPPLPS